MHGAVHFKLSNYRMTGLAEGFQDNHNSFQKVAGRNLENSHPVVCPKDVQKVAASTMSRANPYRLCE